MIETNVRFIGKNNGECLIEHSKMVAEFATEIANVSARKEAFDDFDDVISTLRFAGLLHDISKSGEKNQRALKRNEKLPVKKYSHNETAWAFLSKHLNLKKRIKEDVLYLVYWHHGITAKMGDDTDNKIIESEKPEFWAQHMECLKMLLDEKHIAEGDSFSKGIETPTFFDGDDERDVKMIFLRSCLISADRIVSGLNQFELNAMKSDSSLIPGYVRSIIRRNNLITLNRNPYQNERFDHQKSIASDKSNTIAINAPGGFGKTIIPILNGQHDDRVIIYVAPRNTIARGLYKSILEEISNFGIEDVSVQLFLTGKVAEHNSPNKTPFGTDIIVTNIDNFLTPTVDNRNAGKLFLLMNATVIFDEYHEYVSNSNALFAAFSKIMRLRHNYTNSKTFLLSATPYPNIERLWDTMAAGETRYFPSKGSFYGGQHSKPYRLRMVDENTFVESNSNTLLIYNSMKKCQENKRLNPENYIIHSKYEEWDKRDRLEHILRAYGRNSIVSQQKQNVVSTNMVQTSLNISFSRLAESCINPSSTMQRIARVNRFGEFDEESEILIFNSSNRSENTMKNIVFTSDLTDLWYQHLSMHDNGVLTIDGFYELYRDFNLRNIERLTRFMTVCLDESEKSLKTIYPRKQEREEDAEENVENQKRNIKAGKNKLRSNGNEVFFICEKRDGTFTEPFNQKVYKSIREDFEETDHRWEERHKKRMQKVKDLGDERYDYTDLLDKHKKKMIEIECQNSLTPFIRSDVYYDKILGVVEKEK